MTHQIAIVASVVGFLICIAAALILALGSESGKPGSEETGRKRPDAS